MQPTEDDNIGAFFKQRFEALSDQPEPEVKDSLFEKMDLLEGKRSNTVYLHFNVLGMKVAASLTMLVVSSLAIMAVAAVTVIAVRNNTARKQELPAPVEMPAPQGPVLSPNYPSSNSSLPKETEKATTTPELNAQPEAEPVSQESPLLPEPAVPVNSTPPATQKQDPTPPIAPLNKNGNNQKLLQDVEEEEELFKK